MKVEKLHSWDISPAEAIALQARLSGLVLRVGRVDNPRFVAGVDVAVNRSQSWARAAVVVLRYPGLEPVETRWAEGKLTLPYIPGLLSFREAPLTLAACEQLEVVPDLFMVDGQGIAHPRRLGIASHLGLFLNTPTIGCAKSRLCGEHEDPAVEKSSYTDLVDGGEVIGAVLRTRHAAKPVYVSIGHKLDLENAIHWVLECCRGFRIPEPTRLAHLAAGGHLRYDAVATRSTSSDT